MIKKLCIVLILLSHISMAQTSVEADSLRRMAEAMESRKKESGETRFHAADTAYVNTLLALAAARQSSDLEKTEEYAGRALAISREIDYMEGECLSLIRSGSVQVYKGNYLKALDLFNESYKISAGTNFTRGIANYNYGMFLVYYFQSRYPEALTYLLRCIKLAEQMNDEKELAVCYTSVGSMYNMQGYYKEALANFEKADQLYTKIGDKAGINRTTVNMGVVYLGMNNYEDALKFFFEALEAYRETDNKVDIAFAYISIAQTYNYQKKFTEAETYASKALVIYNQLGNKNGISNCYNTLGKINFRKGKYNESRKYLLEAISISREIGRLMFIKNNYLDLSVLDSACGDFKGAYENYKLFFAFHDSIYNQENTQRLTQQKMQYIFEKKQVADSLAFLHERELAGIKLEKQRALTYGGFGAAALTIVLLFFVYNNYRKQQLANKKLKEAQEQLIRSEKLAAFGVMATRLSHEIQNPLNFVNNFSEVSKDLVNEVLITQNEQDRKQCADLLLDNLKRIREHGDRAASIVRQMQEHSNRGTAHDFFNE